MHKYTVLQISSSSYINNIIMRVIAIVWCLFLKQVACYNIVAIFPTRLISHYIVFDSLMTALVERGHNVTVYHMLPKSISKPGNYTEIRLSHCVGKGHEMGFPYPSEIMNCTPLLELRKAVGLYDALITETFINDFFSIFGYVLGIPVILVHSGNPYPYMCNHFGMSCNPSYVPVPWPHLDLGDSRRLMTFFERLQNTWIYCKAVWFYYITCELPYNMFVRQFYNKRTPLIGAAVQNASLMLLNTHYSITGVRQLPPNVIEIGGISVKNAKPLPEVC